MIREKWSIDNYVTTFQFVAEAHQGQLVPGSPLPYVTHLSLVSVEVIKALEKEPGPLDEDLAVQVSLLHDVLEDTTVGYTALHRRYGAAIADGVAALTKDRSLPKSRQMSDSIERIKTQPKEVWLVKLADRIVNLREPPSTWSSGRRISYREEAERIRDVLGGASHLLAQRLGRKIAAYACFL